LEGLITLPLGTKFYLGICTLWPFKLHNTPVSVLIHTCGWCTIKYHFTLAWKPNETSLYKQIWIHLYLHDELKRKSLSVNTHYIIFYMK